MHHLVTFFSVKLGYVIVNCNREIGSYVRLCTALASVSDEREMPCRVLHCSGTLCSVQKVLTEILARNESTDNGLCP